MNYAHILASVSTHIWALRPDYVAVMSAILAERAFGNRPSAEEIEARIDKRQERKIAESSGDIRVIPVQGVIGNRLRVMQDVSNPMSSAEWLDKQIKAAIEDDRVKVILLDNDSPGGSVYGVPEVADTIRAARGTKPIVAHVNGMCASADYWIASAADEIVMTGSSEIGSVGVYTMHDDLTKFMEEKGIDRTIISAGRYKVEGNPFEPLSEEAREELQRNVDRYYSMFIGAVAEGRGVSVGDVEERFGQGRMFGAAEAIERGMADRIGTLDETLSRFGVSPSYRDRNRRAMKLAEVSAAVSGGSPASQH